MNFGFEGDDGYKPQRYVKFAAGSPRIPDGSSRIPEDTLYAEINSFNGKEASPDQRSGPGGRQLKKTPPRVGRARGSNLSTVNTTVSTVI